MSGHQKRNEAQTEEGKSQSLARSIANALQRRNQWADKDELLDALYWGRQFVSLVIGVCWGVIPLRGILALILYVAISTGIGHSYLTWYQEQDDEEFGGFWEIAKEGFGAAFATFMVSWITVYSTMHFD